MYRCQSEQEAVSCKTCTKFGSGESIDSTNFKIDVAKSNIIREALKNCTVIDKKNWKCIDDTEMSSPINYSRHRQGMSNGQYYGLTEVMIRPIPNESEGINVHRYVCAK